MKVIIELPSEFEQPEISFDTEKRQITIEPRFETRKSRAAIAYITIESGKKVKLRQRLSVRGTTGLVMAERPLGHSPTPEFDELDEGEIRKRLSKALETK